MPVPTIRDEPHRAADPDSPVEERIEARLARIEQRVERGNIEGRRAGRAFMIFAVAALFLAMVELVAIAAKLDNTSTASKQAAPAAPTAAAPAPAAAGRIGVTLKEYSVASSPAVGKAGRVTFNVRNSGGHPPRVRGPSHRQAGGEPAQGRRGRRGRQRRRDRRPPAGLRPRRSACRSSPVTTR